MFDIPEYRLETIINIPKLGIFVLHVVIIKIYVTVLTPEQVVDNAQKYT